MSVYSYHELNQFNWIKLCPMNVSLGKPLNRSLNPNQIYNTESKERKRKRKRERRWLEDEEKDDDENT